MGNFLVKQFCILDVGYRPFGERSALEVLYDPGPGILLELISILPPILLKFLTQLLLCFDRK
jgi:hypothetical protein